MSLGIKLVEGGISSPFSKRLLLFDCIQGFLICCKFLSAVHMILAFIPYEHYCVECIELFSLVVSKTMNTFENVKGRSYAGYRVETFVL